MQNRIIKFRAWDKVRLEMVSSLAVTSDGEVITCDGYTDAGASWSENDHLIPMQFTGLSDKNKVEIYEGDVVRHSYYGENGVAYFYESRVAFGLRDSKGEFLEIFPIDKEHFEVIGNVWENKELLK